MRNRVIVCAGLAVLFVTALALSTSFSSSNARVGSYDKSVPGPDRVLVLDGSGTHDVGQLLIHTANWGIFGSYPSSVMPFSGFPSAEWPAGSGVQHVNIAGLWVGADIGYHPIGQEDIHVSTAAYEMEFRPTDDPIDKIYETHEGAWGGNRIPYPNADDDGDGAVDEDYYDGRDNDGDGLIDEDFAAISQQMFSCWYTDNQPAAIAQYPDHVPLNIMVRQESYQWTDPRFDDFIGIKFTITNIGTEPLSMIRLGFFMDADIGRRSTPSYWADDAAGSWRGIRCAELGPASLSIGYMYDADGDGGQTTSYIGAWVLGNRLDPQNPWGAETAERMGMNSFHIFKGGQPYENGGDPVNDLQRFELMHGETFDMNQTAAGDYRILMSLGSYHTGLLPGNSLILHMGLVCGDGLEGLLDNAAMCQRLFDGLRFDYDLDYMTGVDSREMPLPGPVSAVVIDSCRSEFSVPRSWPRGVTEWINYDCRAEDAGKDFCMLDEADSLLFRTGVAGLERPVHWIYEQPPVEPALSLHGYHTVSLVGVTWRFQLELYNAGPGIARIVKVVLNEESEDVTIPDPDCSFGYLLVGEMSWGDNDGYTVDLTNHPDGSFNAWLDVTYEDLRGNRHQVRIDTELDPWNPTEAAPALIYKLDQNYPNPFNPITTIKYQIPVKSMVNLSVFDVSGRLIRTLVNENNDSGFHAVRWDGRDGRGNPVGSGIYFSRIQAGSYVETKRMVLLR